MGWEAGWEKADAVGAGAVDPNAEPVAGVFEAVPNVEDPNALPPTAVVDEPNAEPASSGLALFEAEGREPKGFAGVAGLLPPPVEEEPRPMDPKPDKPEDWDWD